MNERWELLAGFLRFRKSISVIFFPVHICSTADDLGREPQLVHVIFVIVGAEGGFFSHRVGVGELPRARL
jgi:hypothetical protein